MRIFIESLCLLLSFFLLLRRTCFLRFRLVIDIYHNNFRRHVCRCSSSQSKGYMNEWTCILIHACEKTIVHYVWILVTFNSPKKSLICYLFPTANKTMWLQNYYNSRIIACQFVANAIGLCHFCDLRRMTIETNEIFQFLTYSWFRNLHYIASRLRQSRRLRWNRNFQTTGCCLLSREHLRVNGLTVNCILP